MSIWSKNEPDPERRKATLLVYEDDGVTPAPKTTDFSTGNLIRWSGSAYVGAAGTMVNVGVDGEWEYTATQAETNADASEAVILIPSQVIGGVAYAASRSIAKIGTAVVAGNEPHANRRRITVLIYEDDGVTPADKSTDFSAGNKIRSGSAYVAAAGTMLNVGVDGEWEYTFTRPETDVDSSELVVMVPAQTIGPTSYSAARSIVALGAVIVPVPPPIPPPPPTVTATSYVRMMMALLPPGKVWRFVGSILSEMFAGCADELGRFQGRTTDLLKESVPTTASELLPEYERELKIDTSGTLAEQQARLVARLIARQRYRPVDFQNALASLLGLDASAVDVIERTHVFAASIGDDREIYRFFVYRDPTLPGTYFIDSAQELVDKIKPSHTVGTVIESIDFLCDDPFSLCDRDLLGV